MCEANSSTFFRPWNVGTESSSKDVRLQGGVEAGSGAPLAKQEEGSPSLSPVCTYEDMSLASSSEPESSSSHSEAGPHRRRSGSSAEGSSKTSSVTSDDGNRRLSMQMLNKFSRASQHEENFAGSSVIQGPSPSAFGSPLTAANKPTTSSAAYELEYAARLGYTVNSTLFCGTFSPVHTIQQGMYASSMEHAVEMIHRQDAAAKQVKKLRPKKFRCEYCDVAFSNNGQLKGHIRIHTGERPFKCDAEGCGKSFTRNEELTRHKRIHTGIRPHACLVCGKCFGRKDHLKKHTRTHENRDPYRMSAAALGMLTFGHSLPHAHPFPPYMYPI